MALSSGLVRLFACSVVVGGAVAGTTGSPQQPFWKEKGVVPDEKAAVKVALAILEPIYGKKTLDGEQPFKAKLTKGVWHVEGSLPEGWLGGVAEIEFRKSDCQVLKIIHGK